MNSAGTSTLICDAQIVADGDIERGSVLINREGRIENILSEGSPLPVADVVVDASEMYLFPGVIDEHVHFRDPGLTHKATMATESSAAVAGGVTTVFDMPNVNPQTVTLDAWHEKNSLAKAQMHTNYAFYLGATNDNLDELLKADYSQVCAIKLFMGSSTGGMLVDSDNMLRKLFKESPVLIAAHCEDEKIIRANSEKTRGELADNVPWHLHPQIRSREACIESSTLATQLAREAGARLHLLHITTEEEIALLDKGIYRHITGEACPAHLWFTDDDYQRLGSLIKCNPAIKTRKDRDALRKAVQTGAISTISTDHAPHTLEEKRNHTYWQTPSGMPIIESSLQLMLRLADEGWWDYTTVASRMAENIADLYFLEDRGHIHAGAWADLVLVKKEQLTISNPRYKCGWSPVEGETVNHRIVQTYVSGQLAYDNGQVLPTLGRQLTFSRSS